MRYWQILFISFFTFGQQTDKVDFIKCDAFVYPNFLAKDIKGHVKYEFEVKRNIDTIKIDAINMEISELYINGQMVDYENTGKTINLFQGYNIGKNKLEFHYIAYPKQTLYFIGNDKSDYQIWTQGQGKYTSHWLPSFDDVNEKVIFNLTVDTEFSMLGLSNGSFVTKEPIINPYQRWHYQMKKPMSSYLVMLAIGNYVKQTEKSASGILLEFYLDANDKDKFESTYRYSKQMFDFLEKEIGVKYPWEIYRQIPVKDFLYSGMENTTSTIFAQEFVVDEIGFNDRTYVNVNAHELVHQWFGNMITAKTSKHHWLQEGFATYYALLAEEELFGQDYFNWKLYEMAERLQMVSKTDTIPILNEKASSLTFYQKGAWALHILREKIGKENFRKSVQNYLRKYAFKNVNTDEFLAEVEKVSKINTKDFRKKWLESPGFEIQESLSILRKNTFIENYLHLVSLQDVPFEAKRNELEKFLSEENFYPLKQEVLYQISEIPVEDKKGILKKAFASNDLKVRQALAQTVTEIPGEFRADFESLLYDKSYITQEIALGTLWRLFPDKKSAYLEISKDWIGFEDKNLRILWLTLALITENFQDEQKPVFYDELLSYASPYFTASVRQNALTNLLFLNPNDSNILPYLVNATTHHKWQFTLFARNNIRELLKSEKHQRYFEEMLPDLNESEAKQLFELLKKNN